MLFRLNNLHAIKLIKLTELKLIFLDNLSVRVTGNFLMNSD